MDFTNIQIVLYYLSRALKGGVIMSQNNSEMTGWAGWAAFAGIVMILLGFLHGISGLTAIFRQQFFLVTPNNLLVFDYTTWGWIHLALGILVIFAGFAVLNGRVWGRVLGVIIASVGAIANTAFLPTYPIWSIVMLVIDFVVIYALIVHGSELAE